MRNRQHTIGLLVVVAGAALIVSLVISSQLNLTSRPASSVTSISTSDLPTEVAIRERLQQLGIPIQSVVVQPAPLAVTVTIAVNNPPSSDDWWNRFIAERELSLWYLNSLRIYSFAINGGYTLLTPDMASQQLSPSPPTPAKIDDAQTKSLLEKEFSKFGFQITSLDVTTGKIVRDNTKLVEIRLTVPPLTPLSGSGFVTEADIKFDELMCELWKRSSVEKTLIDRINEQTGAQIAVMRLIVEDTNGKHLSAYFLDTETRRAVYDAGENEYLYRGCLEPSVAVTESPLTSPLPTPVSP